MIISFIDDMLWFWKMYSQYVSLFITPNLIDLILICHSIFDSKNFPGNFNFGNYLSAAVTIPGRVRIA